MRCSFRPIILRFFESDWFQQLPPEHFDVIVSNPPYIVKDDEHLTQGDLRFEPINALTDHADGLIAYRQLIAGAQSFLVAGGRLLMEHGYHQTEQVQDLLKQAGFLEVQSWQDLAGIWRVTGGVEWTSVTTKYKANSICHSFMVFVGTKCGPKVSPSAPYKPRSTIHYALVATKTVNKLLLRVVSDYATFAYLMDVFVLPEHRGRGLSRRLLEAIKPIHNCKACAASCLPAATRVALYQNLVSPPWANPRS